MEKLVKIDVDELFQDRQIQRQTNKQTNKQTDRQTYGSRERYVESFRGMDKQVKQTDRIIDR